MNVHLAYGKQGIDVELDDDWDITVIEPRFVPALPIPVGAIRKALEEPIDSRPLHKQVKLSERVGIIFNDITRATPNQLILPIILEKLENIPPENIVLFDALGTHRRNTQEELRQILGEDIVQRYQIVQNDAFDESTQVRVGTTRRGNAAWLNRQLMDCNLKILTGFIEPHLFAGFSGGGKSIMPGMAGLRTVLSHHGARMIAHLRTTWGVTDGNLFYEEIMEIARMAGNTFLVNVSLNKHQQITGVFAGDLKAAHAAGCDFVGESAMAPVDHAFDIVLTTNSGYPLDQNLYQSIKGVSAAGLIVRQGGAVLLAAECRDGVPEHGQYARLLRESRSPQQVLEQILQEGFARHDQWQVQAQAQVQLKADVFVYSHNLKSQQVAEAQLKPVASLEDSMRMLAERYGPHARICILPEGPQSVPYLQDALVDN
jgi:nickel-dependent lactate racemase